MDSKGRWMDNVMIEQPWRSPKYGWVYLQAFETGSKGEGRDRFPDRPLQLREPSFGVGWTDVGRGPGRAAHRGHHAGLRGRERSRPLAFYPVLALVSDKLAPRRSDCAVLVESPSW